MTKQYDLKRISMIAIVVIIATCLVNCANKKEVDVIKEGLVSVNGQKIILAENSNKNEPLWLLAGDLSGEAMGTVVTRSAAGDNATISGAAYVTPDGDGFTVTLGPEGYPRTISFADGSSMELKNYSDKNVEVTLTSSTGKVIGSQTINLNDNFKELQNLIAENGLTFSTARSSLKKSQSGFRSASASADYASEARTRKTVLKITSTMLSIAGCVGSIFISEVAPPIALIACTSAYAGVVSTVDYIVGTGEFNPNDEAGQISFFLTAGSCVGLSLSDCVQTLLNIADTAIADCIPSKEQQVKGCYKGNVYWYNDCGGRTDPEQECPCGCEGGVCKPAAACQDLTIMVSAGADPSCIAKGETIFFASTVSGGDPASYVYAWDFGDGASSALDSDAHTYASAGSKGVTLTVSDSQGNYGFAAIAVQVEDCENFLEASIGAGAACVEKNKSVAFSAIVRGGVKASYTYQWNFGDGGTGTEKNTSHSYSSDGLYLVSLIVEDSLDNRAVNAVTVEVGKCPDDTDTSTTTTIAATGDRFIDNNNGTVTDTRTGLIWLKNANPCDYKNWAEAGIYCSSLKSGDAGLADGSTAGQWRLPTLEELEGLGTDPPITYCTHDTTCDLMVCPATWTMPGAPFTGVQSSSNYWSGTSSPNDAGYVWIVTMSSGFVFNGVSKSSKANVWPIRGGN